MDSCQAKKTIRAILISARNGLSPQQLLRDYDSIVGEPLPLKELGFTTLSDAIHGMPDVIKVERTSYGRTILRGIPDKSSKHIASLVSRQRSTKQYNGITAQVQSRTVPAHKPFKPSQSTSKQVPASFTIKLRQLMISYPNGLSLGRFQEAFQRRFGYFVSVKLWGFSDLEEAFRSMKDTIEVIDKNGERVMVIASKETKKVDRLCSSLNSVERSSPDREQSPVINKELLEPKKSIDDVTEELSKLLESFPSGLLVSNVPQEYKNLYHQDFPASALGYSSVLKLLSGMPKGFCDMKQLDSASGEWIVFKGKGSASTGSKPDSQDQLIVPESLAKFLKQLIKRQSCPVLVETLPLIYKGVTNKDIPFLTLGFTSLAEMLRHTPGISVKETSSGRMITIDDDVDMPSIEKTNEQPVAIEKLEPEPHLLSSYTRQTVSSDSRTVGVYVTFVKSPSCICVQIIREDTTQALDSLHDDMAMYYNSTGAEQCVIKNPKIGQPCCARYNNDGYWYRGEIIRLPHSDTAEVLYVDYGNKAIVPRGSLRQPKAHYLSLPAQGVLCRLCNIQPPGPTWSKRASQLLFEMTKDKAIAAIITKVTKSCISACLCDTSTEKDIHINDFLVAQGLAIFAPDSLSEDQFDTYQVQQPPVESSAQDLNVRLPTSQDPSVKSLHPPPPPLLAPPPSTTGNDYSQLMPTSQQALAQLIALNSVMLGQGVNQNSNNSNLMMNPFLPFPVLPDSLLSAPHVNGTQFPNVKPNKDVRPPPGFENLASNGTSSDPLKKTSTSDGLLYIKKIELPSSKNTLHVMRYGGQAYVLGKEISSWLWEADMLSFHLKRVKRSFTVEVITREKAPQLYESLIESQSSILWEVLAMESLALYPLSDVPDILKVLKAPEPLLEAVTGAVDLYNDTKERFWLREDVSQLEQELTRLQDKRTVLLGEMTHNSTITDSSLGMTEQFKRFMSIDDEIKSTKMKLEQFRGGVSSVDNCGKHQDVVGHSKSASHVAKNLAMKELSEFSDSSDDSMSEDSTSETAANTAQPTVLPSNSNHGNSTTTQPVVSRCSSNGVMSDGLFSQPDRMLSQSGLLSQPVFVSRSQPSGSSFFPMINQCHNRVPPPNQYHPVQYRGAPPFYPPPRAVLPPNQYHLHYRAPPLNPYPVQPVVRGTPPLLPMPPPPTGTHYFRPRSVNHKVRDFGGFQNVI